MNNDVVTLLYQIKDNIKNLNNENSKQKLIDIKADYLEMMELLKLFLISERNTYYGYFLMNMKFDVDFKSKDIAGIKLNIFPPVFTSNPLNLCRFKLKEIIYIICHEIDHIVLNHPSEMIKSNPKSIPEVFYKFNLAADASVNDRLDNEILSKNKYMERPSGAITSEVLAEMFNLKGLRKMECYAYYFNIIKDLPLKEELTPNDYLINELNGAGTPIDYDSENNNECEISDGNSNMEDHEWNSDDSSFNMEDLVKEFINSTSSMIGTEARGLMPSDFIEQIELINKPAELSWKQILKKYVGTIVAGKRKTRTRLNRRQPERYDLSGRMDDKIIKIVVAIDTSGSMSSEQISNIFNEIFSIVATRKKEITVIECDSEIQRVYKIKNRSDVNAEVLGRGGTSFSPVIKYINNDKYYRDSLLIYFTDGYGESRIPKPLTYRNIWVLIDSDYLSLKNPYGIVLHMD